MTLFSFTLLCVSSVLNGTIINHMSNTHVFSYFIYSLHLKQISPCRKNQQKEVKKQLHDAALIARSLCYWSSSSFFCILATYSRLKEHPTVLWLILTTPAIQTFTKMGPVRAKLFHVDKRVHLCNGSS